MKRFYLIAAISSMAYVAGAQNYADSTYNGQIQEARKLISGLKEDLKIPGISVAVGKGGQIIWKEGIGLANIKKGEEVTPATKFRIGSISKTLTALALGKLFDEAKIDWSDSVAKYVSFQDAPEYSFSIRQLAGHQAGIRHYKGLEFFSNKQFNSVEESLEVFKDDKLMFEPGMKYQYSTYGYSLLGRLIEVVSKESYLDFMSNEVLEPLGMENTLLEDAGLDESGKAVFYRKGGMREAGEVNLSVKWAGGGFLSTPSDLVNMINYSSKLVSFSTLQELITPQRLLDGSATGYGIGFRISLVQSTNQTVVHHGGRMVGARAFLLVLLDQQLVIAICTNTEADFGVNEVYGLAKLFIDEQP